MTPKRHYEFLRHLTLSCFMAKWICSATLNGSYVWPCSIWLLSGWEKIEPLFVVRAPGSHATTCLSHWAQAFPVACPPVHLPICLAHGLLNAPGEPGILKDLHIRCGWVLSAFCLALVKATVHSNSSALARMPWAWIQITLEWEAFLLNYGHSWTDFALVKWSGAWIYLEMCGISREQ